MFLLRGTVVVLASSFLLYLGSSLLLALICRLGLFRIQRASSRTLFILRVAPMALAMFVAAILLVPSFVGFEPRGTQETIGLLGAAFALAGLAILGTGAAHAFRAWRHASQFLANQVTGSAAFAVCGKSKIIEVASELAGPVVVGIHHPTLLVPSGVRESLSGPELNAAIRHESAHVVRRDNLKKLTLQFLSFPFLSEIEEAWNRAAEIDADALSVRDPQEALDLASALLKIAQSKAKGVVPRIAMSLVPRVGAPLAMRVERLLLWTPQTKASSRLPMPVAGALLLAAATVAWGYAPLLGQVHEWTELLLR